MLLYAGGGRRLVLWFLSASAWLQSAMFSSYNHAKGLCLIVQQQLRVLRQWDVAAKCYYAAAHTQPCFATGELRKLHQLLHTVLLGMLFISARVLIMTHADPPGLTAHFRGCTVHLTPENLLATTNSFRSSATNEDLLVSATKW